MAREPDNPVKMRAQQRASEIGKTLAQVYAEARVNKAYLTERPKSGWRSYKLEAIARSLGWSVDQLIHGDKAIIINEALLVEMTCEAVVAVMRIVDPDGKAKAINAGHMGRMLFELLRQGALSGEPVTQHLLINIGLAFANSAKARSIP